MASACGTGLANCMRKARLPMRICDAWSGSSGIFYVNTKNTTGTPQRNGVDAPRLLAVLHRMVDLMRPWTSE